MLISVGTLLILGPEFFYLRDNFGYRINTVFKFYFQAWILLSIAAAFTVAVLLHELRGLASIFYTALIIIVIAMGMFYPVFSLPNKTDDFQNQKSQPANSGWLRLSGRYSCRRITRLLPS